MTAKINKYRVSFDVKANNTCYSFAIDLYATDSKAARAEAERLWYADHKNHMFHISTERFTKNAKPTEFYADFTEYERYHKVHGYR